MRQRINKIRCCQYFTVLLLSLLIVIGCTGKKELLVSHLHPDIEYWGRVDTSQIKGTELYWSGTSVKFNFEGESIQVLLKDENGINYYNVIINSGKPQILNPGTDQRYYPLALQLPKGKHTIEIFKRSEWDRGKTTFYGFKIGGNPKVLSKTTPKKRKIEFYGNSITAGYAVEDISGEDSPAGTFTNNYLSYAAITARHFDAEYSCICKSGIGIMISWFPLTMPEMYNRLNPADPQSSWDFSRYTPDIVVINLFQNDSWLVNMPESEEFKAKFGNNAPDDDDIINSYQRFVAKIRSHYPQASIICALGNMDASIGGSKWIEIVKQAVNGLNDKKIHALIMPYKGTPGHPSIQEQEDMATSLIQFIKDNIDW